jgi:8-hydroxy-5-deazaflavin:NADPH oxidoreductase
VTVEHVAVVGATGDLGFGLALRWAKAGIEIVIGSRAAERAESAAARLKERVPDARVSGLVNETAASSSDVVVVTVPFAGQAEIYKSIADHIREGAVVVDCTVPLATAVGGRAVQTLGVWHGSAAQQAESLLAKGKGVLCSAFHTLAAGELENLDVPVEGDVLVCGSKRDAKQRVAELVDAIPNLRFVDAGRLENAKLIEPLTALLVGINIRYKTRAGIRITGLPGD